MGARLGVFLTREQDKTLLNLRTRDLPQKVKDRAEVIRLKSHDWYLEKIAAHYSSFQISSLTLTGSFAKSGNSIASTSVILSLILMGILTG